MGLNILAVICARGGSTGVPGKNIKPIAGKPLIAWSIERAKLEPRISNLIISTDDESIKKVSERYGASVPFTRPAHLATSSAGKFGVWKHALTECEKIFETTYDIFIDIDCTTPLLDSKDLSGILDTFLRLRDTCSIDGLFTVSPSHRSPYFNLVEEDPDGYLHLSKTWDQKIESRQKSPKTWDIVAGHYIFNTDYIRRANYLLDGNLRGYETPRDKSFDIDEPFDFELVEWLLSRQIHQGQ